MDEFEVEIKKDFLSEALMNLDETEEAFMQLEGASEPGPLLDKIFRLAHNLKGSSRAVGFGEVAEFTHEIENLVLQLQKGLLPLNTKIVTTLLCCNDRLIEMLNGLKADLQAKFDCSDLIKDIREWLSGSKTEGVAAVAVEVPAPTVTDSSEESLSQPLEVSAAVGAPSVEVESASEGNSEKTPEVPASDSFWGADDQAANVQVENVKTEKLEAIEVPAMPPESIAKPAEPVAKTQSSEPKQAEQKQAEKSDEIVRVSLSRIDLLNDYVGELIVLQSVINQQATVGDKISLQGSLRQMMKLSKDIQSVSMNLRMLPVKPLVQKLQRVVRDTSQALGKKVVFEVRGEQIDVDKSVLDRMADPLVHMLRNAVDHGLESTEDRVNAGKSPEGHVELSFNNEGNHLVIQVKDDGKGINPDALRKRAIEKKIISETNGLTEKDLINLIFHPGFSTKTETSEISGRGVGMDVVKTNIEKSGGQVEISTVVGKGSIFRVQIPLSLAVIDGLVVASEGNRYVIPLNQVQETINLKTHQVFNEKKGIGSCFNLRGSVVPIYDLDEVLTGRPLHSQGFDTALVVSVRDHLIAITVKDILRSQQIVIKPLTNGIEKQKGWIGSCVLGDGLPTLILNPIELLEGRVSFQLDDAQIRRVN